MVNSVVSIYTGRFRVKPAIFQEQVSDVKLQRYNKEYLYAKFNGHGDKGERRFQE